jgi:hypothetical protein
MPIHLGFQITLNDFLAAYEFHWRLRRMGSWRGYMVGLVGIGVALLYLSCTSESRWLGWVLLGVSCVMATLPLIRTLLYLIWWRSLTKYHHPYEMDFDDNGIHFKTKGVDSRLAWSVFSAIAENEPYWLLYYQSSLGTFAIVPKAACRNTEERDELGRLFNAHIPKRL